MQPTQVSKADRPPDIEPTIRHVVPWRVVAVTAVSDFHLQVTFVDGTRGEVDLRNFLNSADAVGTVFEPLRDPALFAQAQVVMGAVQWANGADLAPDAMYDAIKAHGRWVVG
ncbi:MAG TPA: DUF2442 domain-containing protein [Nitrospira sp.]|jgi:hypothetical protein|nr:DUF2442 domain-containing protein [Nitrospira sp.]